MHAAFGGTRRRKKGKGKMSTPSLLKHITDEVTQKVQDMGLGNAGKDCSDEKLFCKRCTKPGHKTDDCYLWNRKKCSHCDKFNHASEDCFFKDKPKPEKKSKVKDNSHKRARTEEANTADSDRSYAAIEEVEEIKSGGITFDASERGQFFNFDNENVANSSINDEHTLYYDWLADSATTSHITNQHDTFVTYEPIQNTLITGVGGLQAQAEGRGDVNIITSYNSTSYLIRLYDVLYIPGNKNNLFSLGRWIAKGGDFMGRKLILISKQGDIIVNGKLTKNNLIKFRFRYAKREIFPRAVAYPSLITPKLSWDTWHRRFGHISYSRLKNLFDRKLVSGFNVD
jgi:hypothetical protein